MARHRGRQGEGHLYRRSRIVTLRNGRTAKCEYGSWKVKYYEHGKQHTLDLGTQDRDCAQRKYADWLAAHLSAESPVADGSIQVRQYMDAYIQRREEEARTRRSIKNSSIIRYKNAVRNFQLFLHEEGLDYLQMANLQPKHFEAYLNWRIRQTRFHNKSTVKVTESGANWDLTVLGIIVKRAVADGLIRKDPTRDVQPFHKPKVTATPVPSPETVAEILACITEAEARSIVGLIAATGLRTQEAQHLKWQDIDWERRLLHIRPDAETNWSPKTEKSIRSVPFPENVSELLRNVQRHRLTDCDDYIFRLPDGRPQHVSRNYPYKRLQSAIRQLNRKRKAVGGSPVEFFTCRSLRHFFISWSLNRHDNPLNPLEVQAIVGHTNLDMIMQTYYHPDLEGTTGEKIRSAPPSFLPELPSA